ncbi:protein sorting system archaetidylserine decarboxylase [Halorussus lipolyticus]|uniref:protein sorting system archaetidylserine decarboxylase n=1 Tax=Halorussus lipolyticus TaxID=3034024 RepID=UPI0023E78BDB|nr:protein sorting system archaetidylserine decarboxylase [Halorussus sp. DT80]
MGEKQDSSRWRLGDGFTPGAWRYALLALAVAIPSALVARSEKWARRWGVAGPLLAVGALLFHRDPDRNPAPDVASSGVIAPADGRVSVVREETGPDGDERVRVGVFMNVTDVHVNRAPLGGEIEAVEHEPGKHRPAFSKESDNNEKLHIRFSDHVVTLIAGAFARRIHPYVEPGDELGRGERLGHISFGSRADVLLPAEFDPDDVAVERGRKVRAGETVLARR